MSDSIKVKVASAVTVLFLGGIAAAGLIARSGGEDPVATGASEPLVVHRTQVRTVRAPSPPATVPGAAYVPAPAAAPSPISTRVSPAGRGGDDEDEGGFDQERESE